ncbi:hypothetical protein LWI28_021632 [Acer negundo]|uniref:Uncharacterized protein n=1 Tax=Acer negundo TaxID=4023 RepID=A0AAD5JEV3_ACENE|nr:hypothetical protein LWI28_021632 [Acer negundo]
MWLPATSRRSHHVRQVSGPIFSRNDGGSVPLSVDRTELQKLGRRSGESSDCCQWVICATTSESRPVIALYLDSLVFISFFGVTSLMILGISSNYIQGEIPGHAYANLTKLVDLDMKQNSFTGSIPLQNLRELSLEDNRFRGSIPEEIGNLSKLQRLSLRGNSFVGGIPSSLVSLKELQVLDLRENSLS